MENEAAGAFHTRGFPMWTGVHTAAVSYTDAYAARANPSARFPDEDEEDDDDDGGGGGGGGDRKRILSGGVETESREWERERKRKSSLYISTGMPTETSPYFSIQSSVLFFLSTTRYPSDASSRTTAVITHPRDHCSPSMDLIVRQVIPRVTRVANDSVGYVFLR